MIPIESVVTLEHVDGYRIVTTFGYARGQATRPRDALKATFRSIGAFIGLAPIEYLTEAEKAREESLFALRRHAASMGANGVIGLQFQTSETEEGTRVLCYGKAVLLEAVS
ncbi:MAG: hypothetical protein DLM50_09930 [Candidatus Meridianibacter frigidus]|nr:MAG: hypothetical protein DLM50_09930 [Candidatus Eremiobacteraeota bacterium]